MSANRSPRESTVARAAVAAVVLLAIALVLLAAARGWANSPSVFGQDHRYVIAESHTRSWRIDQSGLARPRESMDEPLDATFVTLHWDITYESPVDLPLIAPIPMWIVDHLTISPGDPSRPLSAEQERAATAAIWERLERGEPDWEGSPYSPRLVALGPTSYAGLYAVGIQAVAAYLLAIASVVAAFIIVIMATVGHVRRVRRLRRGACAVCGYALAGIASEACPECGMRTTHRGEP